MRDSAMRSIILDITDRMKMCLLFDIIEYCIHFWARFGRLHAFGYNSAEGEPIWMKSGTL